jgi:hypothetical protein
MSSSDNYPPYYPRPIIEDQKLPLSSPGDHHSFSFSPQNHTGGFSPQPQRWTYASAGTSYPATLPHEYRIPANGMVIDSNEHTSRNSVTEATSLLAPGIIPMAPGTVDVSTAGRSATSAVLGQTYSSAVGGRVHGQGYLSHGKKDNGHQTVALAMSNYISSRHQSQSYQQQQSQRIGQPSNPQQFNTLAQQYAQEPATYRSSNSALALSSSPYSKPSLPSQLHANKRSGERRRTQQPQMTNICQVSEQLSQLQQQSQPDKEDRFPRLVPAVSSAASSPDVYQNSISSTTPCVSVGVCLSVGLYPTVLQQQSTDTPTESLVGGPTQLSPQLSSAQSQAMEAERDHMASRNQVAQHQHHPHGLVSLLAAHSKSVSTFPELQSMIKIPQGHCQQPPERLNSQQAPVTQRPHSQQANQLTAQNQQQQLERERHQIDRQRQLDQVQLWQEQEQQYRKEKHRQEQPRQHKQKEEEWNGERRQVQMRLKQDVQHQAQDRSTLKNRTSPTGMQEISELKPRLYLPEPALPKSLATKPLNPVVKDKYSLPRSELQEGSGELYQRPTCQTLRRNAQSLQPLPQVQTTSQSETDTEPQSPYSSAHTQAHQLHNLSPEMIIYPPPPTGQPKNQQPQIGTPHVQQQYQLQQHQMHQYQNQPQLIPTSTPFVLSLAGEHDESQPLHDIQHSQQHLQENNEAYQHTANSIPSIPTLDGQDPVDRAFMEKRMRELVDTMRFYQSKDPSAFHSVWESVRKETGEPPPLTPGGDPSFPQRAKPIGIDIGPSAPPAALVAQKLCNAQSTQRQHQDSGLDLTGAKPTASMSPRQQQLHLPTLPSRQPQPQPESQMSLPPEVRWLRKYPTKQNVRLPFHSQSVPTE